MYRKRSDRKLLIQPSGVIPTPPSAQRIENAHFKKEQPDQKLADLKNALVGDIVAKAKAVFDPDWYATAKREKDARRKRERRENDKRIKAGLYPSYSELYNPVKLPSPKPVVKPQYPNFPYCDPNIPDPKTLTWDKPERKPEKYTTPKLLELRNLKKSQRKEKF